MLILFAAAICVSAALLFLVQPLFTSLVLPMLGGSPSVWNTATMFYQLVLLAGYVYAHFTRNKLRTRTQVIVHGIVALLPLLVLPIAVPAGWTPPTTTNPIPWLLLLMAVAVGLPFFAVSTTSPLIQSWFSRTGHPAAKDPYFLYAASNVGSLLGLLVYPFVLQPALQLHQISLLWSFGYGVFILLIGACAITVLRKPQPILDATAPVADTTDTTNAAEKLTLGRRMRWILLAFVPSSLMLSVTTFISTDVASMPMLWVVPLALYLLTFIFAFSKRQLVSYKTLTLVMKACLLPMVLLVVVPKMGSLWITLGAHLLVFFIVSLTCHTALAQDRPAAKHLTEFYLFMSLGGALGGMFNALIAPLIFNTVTEYPLVLGLAALLLWQPSKSPKPRTLDLVLPVLAGALVAAGLAIAPTVAPAVLGGRTALLQLSILGLAACVPLLFLFNNLRYGLTLAAVLLAGGVFYAGDYGNNLVTRRSFFGVSRVTYDADMGNGSRWLLHGTTVHGMQHTDATLACEPMGYYTRNSPIGQTLTALAKRQDRNNVGVVGLGSGGLAAYARPNDTWTYFEIDPVVEEIARDPHYFSFLSKCAPQARVVLGDGRLSLAQTPDASFDALVLDAYSSDSLPMHLLTREAAALYMQKVRPGGLLVFHISNRYFDLQPALGNIAHDLGLTAIVQYDIKPSEMDQAQGRAPSIWLIMARDSAALQPFVNDSRWQVVAYRPDKPIWTDSYSSILTALK